VRGVESQTGTVWRSERGLCGRTNARLDVGPYGETCAGWVEEWACRQEKEISGSRCLKNACLAWSGEVIIGGKSRSARPATWVSHGNNDEHRASQTALGASIAACAAGWYVYIFLHVWVDTCHAIVL
jgi:hypothetical protein